MLRTTESLLCTLARRLSGSRGPTKRRSNFQKRTKRLGAERLEDGSMLTGLGLTDFQDVSSGASIERTVDLGGTLSLGSYYLTPPSSTSGVQFNFSAAPGTPQAVQDGFADAAALWSDLLFD